MVPFSKYHGCGNDFIIIAYDGQEERAYSKLAEKVCHRHLGIGADGLIVVKEDPLEMIFFNSDGSRAPMCGNGIRCFARHCYDEGICRETSYKVETLAGPMHINLICEKPFLVEINMGKPEFGLEKIGILADTGETGIENHYLKKQLSLQRGSVEVSSCFMGTIHTVLWLDDLGAYDVKSLGREISNHPVFIEKTNVNMVQVLNEDKLMLKTYERGAGMTYACGTGACASLVIGHLEGRCNKEVEVILPLGSLYIRQDAEGEVFMTGPAEKIGEGRFIDV